MADALWATWYDRPSPPVTSPGAAPQTLTSYGMLARVVSGDADIEPLRALEHEDGDATQAGGGHGKQGPQAFFARSRGRHVSGSGTWRVKARR